MDLPYVGAGNLWGEGETRLTDGLIHTYIHTSYDGSRSWACMTT